MIQKLRLFLILPLFFYGCGVIESEYKPDIAIEIEHNLPVIDGVPTLTLNQNRLPIILGNLSTFSIINTLSSLK